MFVVIGPEVKVEPVLNSLRLRDPYEQDPGQLVRRRSNLTHVGRFVNDDPPECLLPPAS